MNVVRVSYFGVLFVLTLPELLLSARVLRLLREDHPAIFESLGSPTLVLNQSRRSRWLTTRFLLTGAEKRLRDPGLTRACRWMRILFVVYVLWFFLPFVWLASLPH